MVWARLRVREAGTAEVFDSDGNTLAYDSEDTARAALMDAEFVALEGLDDDDAADRGFDLDEIVPPHADDDDALRAAHGPATRRRATEPHVHARAPSLEPTSAALDALVARRYLHHPDHRRDGAPCVSHLPVLYRRDGDRVELRGHWARPNPQSHARRPGARDRARPARVRVAVAGTRTRKPRRACRPGTTPSRTCTARWTTRRRPTPRRDRRRPQRAFEAQRRQRLALRVDDDAHRVAAARHRRLPPARRTRRAEVQAQPEPPATRIAKR